MIIELFSLLRVRLIRLRYTGTEKSSPNRQISGWLLQNQFDPVPQ